MNIKNVALFPSLASLLGSAFFFFLHSFRLLGFTQHTSLPSRVLESISCFCWSARTHPNEQGQCPRPEQSSLLPRSSSIAQCTQRTTTKSNGLNGWYHTPNTYLRVRVSFEMAWSDMFNDISHP
ncbi:MAG: hypothetical protein BYD32DRAFT_417282 [Podila humilis]|nr:MAG: hypothetical protein BYD32DRAFT_417282 [Podila humilis]